MIPEQRCDIGGRPDPRSDPEHDGGTLSAFAVRNGKNPLRVLRLLLRVEETSAPYNQFSLPMMNEQNITICTYFRSKIPPAPALRFFEGDGSLSGFARTLKAALTEGGYDIVHVHSPHLGLFFLLGALLWKPGLLNRSVYTVHSSYEHFKLRNRLFLIPVFAAFRRIVCCGSVSARSFPAYFRRLAGTRLRTVRNGVDLRRVDQAARAKVFRRARDTFVILSAGRLIEAKSPFAVLDAFRRIEDGRTHLFFVGDGDLRARLRARIDEWGIRGPVALVGEISREDVFTYMRCADVFVSASRVEGVPVAVLEAMASRLPVVLSDIPAHREIAGGADCAALFPPDDGAALAREIARFREMTSPQRAEIGARCRRIVEERFDLAATLRRYRGIYEELAGVFADHRSESSK